MRKSGNRATINDLKFDDFSSWYDRLAFRILDKNDMYAFIMKDLQINRIWTSSHDRWVIQFCDEILTVAKTPSRNGMAYIFSISYQSVSYPIFNMNILDEKRSEMYSWTHGVFTFYGAFFRLQALERFSSLFIETLDNYFSDKFLYRVDYRYDFFFLNNPPLMPNRSSILQNARKNRKWRNWDDWWDVLESWDFWRKKNRTIFIRMYNKLVQLSWNLSSITLYWDIIKKYKWHFRLEYELWERILWIYQGKDLPQVLNMINTMVWIIPWNFSWNMYTPKIVIDLTDEFMKTRYIKVFRSMAQNLKNNWFNPCDFIINLD